jgi:hypothetical protein
MGVALLATAAALLTLLECVAGVSQTIVIAGGSLSALAAALTAANVSQALQLDIDVILLEPTDWPGGQLTSSNVPPDFGKQNSIPRNLPASFVTLLEKAINDPAWKLNPGECWVSYKCFEAQLAADYISNTLLPQFPRLNVMYNTVVKKATFDASTRRVTAIEAIHRTPVVGTGYDNSLSHDLSDWYSPADSRAFTKLTLAFRSPAVVIEATEFGDVLSTAALTHSQGIEIPTEESDLTDANCGQSTVLPFYMQLATNPVEPDHVPKGSDGGQPFSLGTLNWVQSWTYRRSLSAHPTNASVASRGDSSNQNYNNDYGGGYLFASNGNGDGDWSGGINVTVLAAAEQRSYGYYHFIKSVAAAEQRPNLYMPLAQTGTAHGLSKTPYLRDSRRVKRGLDGFRLLYEHLNASNPEDGGASAMHFNDTVAIGVYPYADMHLLQHCAYPDYITCCNHPVKPYYIPFRALTSSEVDNMLVPGKGMAQSFLANAATRLHPTEWSTGVAAGAAAALMASRGWSSVRNVSDAIGELQALLTSDAVRSPLTWTL